MKLHIRTAGFAIYFHNISNERDQTCYVPSVPRFHFETLDPTQFSARFRYSYMQYWATNGALTSLIRLPNSEVFHGRLRFFTPGMLAAGPTRFLAPASVAIPFSATSMTVSGSG